MASDKACSDLLATGSVRRATSFAAAIDVIQAGAALEDAIAASSQSAMQAQLGVVGAWLRQASTHYLQVGDGGLAARADCAAAQAEAWAQIPMSPAAGSLQVSLGQFQSQTLVAFHGVLRRLSDDAAAQGSRDTVELFYASVLVTSAILVSGWFADRQGDQSGRRRATR